jgi:hypothetical protein
MNTYDPASSIVYVHMAPEADPWSRPLVETRRCNQLPTGYANRTSRTRLRSDPGRFGCCPTTMVGAHDQVAAGNREHRDTDVASGQ